MSQNRQHISVRVRRNGRVYVGLPVNDFAALTLVLPGLSGSLGRLAAAVARFEKRNAKRVRALLKCGSGSREEKRQ